MNKKGFLDPEILYSPAFVILSLFALTATVLGYFGGKSMGIETSFPIWQLLIIMAVEVLAAYVITLRMS